MKTLSKLNIKNQAIHAVPEIELILCCVRPQVDDATTARIKSLVKENNIDWQKFVQKAHSYSVVSLVYTRLNTICPEFVPEPTLAELRSFFQAIAARNLFLTGELVKLLSLMQEQGIVAVPYKGPVLASLIYGNVALRQFGDLDIIVEQKDIFAVKKLLLAQGYRCKVNMTYAEEIAYLQCKTQHTYDFIHDDKQIFIEVHWRIAPKYVSPIEPQHLWKDLEPFSLAGTTVSNLPNEDWLPILCVHASRHIWTRLACLCDIATLIQNNPNLNWEKVLKQANAWGCRRILFLGLFLAHHLLEVVLPEEIWQQVKAERRVTTLLPQVYNQLFHEVTSSDRFLGRTLYHIQIRERLQDKVLYFQSFFYWLMTARTSGEF
ncbi:nucleotidyltransferase domain-containing protein [Scytonema sp. PRP1]|uniref:nucleotidyltransferase domain-containing protein n=1 Tax=Scytonema sp. PRP1 TaxID=3120513 RepID=UPI002FD115EB